MKFSKDNTPLLVGLFVLAAIIIALIVYYTIPGEQTSDTTTELKIENLTLSRTLNPDPSVSSGTSGYTIEPYGVEYLTGDTEYKTLSKNVTFTMNWTNSPGFTGVVKGFKIKHYVKATGSLQTQTSYPTDANLTLLKKTTAVSPETISIDDFGACSATIVSDGSYLVIGQNSFKLYAVVQEVDKTFDWNTLNTQKDVLLYDGTTETTEPSELKIEKNQLSATLSMTSADTVSYTPERITSTTTSTSIFKYPYKITNNAATLNIGDNGVYLTLIPGTMGKHFNFTYSDGDYLRDDLTKGPVTTTNGKTKFKFEIVDKVGSVGKIRKVGTTTTADSNSEFLSSDDKTLKLYTKTHQDLNAIRFAGFNWTFGDWGPIDCQGTHAAIWSSCSNQCGTGTQTKTYTITRQPNDLGKPCDPDLSQICSSYAGCPPTFTTSWTKSGLSITANLSGIVNGRPEFYAYLRRDNGTTLATHQFQIGQTTTSLTFTEADYGSYNYQLKLGTVVKSSHTETYVRPPVNCTGTWGVCMPNGGLCGMQGARTYTVTQQPLYNGELCKDAAYPGQTFKDGDKKICDLGVCATRGGGH